MPQVGAGWPTEQLIRTMGAPPGEEEEGMASALTRSTIVTASSPMNEL